MQNAESTMGNETHGSIYQASLSQALKVLYKV